MKYHITCLFLITIASCKAGYEIKEDNGSPNDGSSHAEYNSKSSPSSSPSDHGHHSLDTINYQQEKNSFTNLQSNHDFPQINNDFSGQFHDFSNAKTKGFSPVYHDFSAGVFSAQHGVPAQGGFDYTAALAQAGHDFSGGNAQVYPGLALNNHGHERGFEVGPHNDVSAFGATGDEGDSYIRAAHESAHQGDGAEYNSHSDGPSASGPSGSGPSGLSGQNEQAEQHYNFQGGPGQHQSFILQDGGHEYGTEQQHFPEHGFNGQVDTVPIGEHTDYENPVAVPLYKHVTVPVHKPLQINVPKPILVGVPQPYPVKVPIHKPVAVPIETEISIPVVKPVPYPVVKHVPYPVEKHVPFKVEKTVTIPVPHPYPVRVPVYKTIHHHKEH